MTLQERYEKQKEINKELVDENEELKKDKEYLNTVNNEQTEVILTLSEHIEKMKCCGNCKHYRYDFEDRYCVYNATREKECINHSEWELAKNEKKKND